MDKNMQDLMDAARIKLQTQSQEFEEVTGEEDIYAELREEMENDDNDYQPPRPADIKNSPSEDGFEPIKYSPDEYDDFYIDPDEEPMFPEGPGMSQINLWKKQFEKEKIYHTQIIERHFVFRTLNRFEYKQIVAYENLDALRREELICQTCTLWPENYDFKVMAADDSGYPSTLAQIIMENSGFTKEYGIEVL